MECPWCAMDLDPDSEVCPYCKNPVTVGSARRNKAFKWLVIIVLLCFIVLLFGNVLADLLHLLPGR